MKEKYEQSLVDREQLVYLALLSIISVIFSAAFFGNMYEEHLHVTGNFDKYVEKAFPGIMLH